MTETMTHTAIRTVLLAVADGIGKALGCDTALTIPDQDPVTWAEISVASPGLPRGPQETCAWLRWEPAEPANVWGTPGWTWDPPGLDLCGPDGEQLGPDTEPAVVVNAVRATQAAEQETGADQ